LTGVLLGIGIIGFLDEAIFHQLLQWHAFYWATDEHGRILSDGLFHVVSTGLLLWGGFRLWQTPRSLMRSSPGALVAAILIGGGAFNAYDGIVQHVLLHWHLVDEYVCASPQVDNSVTSCPNDIPLEIIWIAVGTGLVVIGSLWWRRSKLEPSGPRAVPGGGVAQQHA
jgi:uncharacterized membrane protein